MKKIKEIIKVLEKQKKDYYYAERRYEDLDNKLFFEGLTNEEHELYKKYRDIYFETEIEIIECKLNYYKQELKHLVEHKYDIKINRLIY